MGLLGRVKGYMKKRIEHRQEVRKAYREAKDKEELKFAKVRAKRDARTIKKEKRTDYKKKVIDAFGVGGSSTDKSSKVFGGSKRSYEFGSYKVKPPRKRKKRRYKYVKVRA